MTNDKFAYNQSIDANSHYNLRLDETGAARFFDVRHGAERQVLTLTPATWQQLAGPVSAVLRQCYSLSAAAARFTKGDNRMMRLAGCDVRPLLQAAELAEQRGELARLPTIIKNWSAMEDHARWWLHLLSSTEAVETDQAAGFGWRHAVYVGLAGAL